MLSDGFFDVTINIMGNDKFMCTFAWNALKYVFCEWKEAAIQV